MESVARIS